MSRFLAHGLYLRDEFEIFAWSEAFMTTRPSFCLMLRPQPLYEGRAQNFSKTEGAYRKEELAVCIYRRETWDIFYMFHVFTEASPRKFLPRGESGIFGSAPPLPSSTGLRKISRSRPYIDSGMWKNMREIWRNMWKIWRFSSYILLFSSYFSIFLGLGKMPSFLLDSGTWKNSKLPPSSNTACWRSTKWSEVRGVTFLTVSSI